MEHNNLPSSNETYRDILIIGAGPIGLFAVFELGLLGLNATLVDSLDKPGGQCAELYPDKPIYDIPAIPVCKARELVDNLMKQIEPFKPEFFLNQEVLSVNKIKNECFEVQTTQTKFVVKKVVIAAGAGVFRFKKMNLAGLEDYENTQVFYRIEDINQHKNKDLIILGGGDSALDWAMELSTSSKSLSLIHRSKNFKASASSIDAFMSLTEQDKINFYEASVLDYQIEQGKITHLKIKQQADNSEIALKLEQLLVFYGLIPNIKFLKDWGLELENDRHIIVDTEKFETNIEGIFAIGDINYYPGKKKLILSGFHEAALMAFAVKKQLAPNEKIMLQYTTTSPQLHKKLGITE